MSGWISVKDELPLDYFEVLYIAITDTGIKEIMTGHRQKGEWTHCCCFYLTKILQNCTVTHWMPLPEYPKENKNE
ncbi:MAG TPA: DUF551 domain-containing protein [Aquella sp.]|nr:DUF551 domain-containing protein [Aquella sp.]